MMAIVAWSVSALAGAVASTPPAATTPVSWDRYRVVVERNIFSQQRGRMAVGLRPPGPAPAAASQPVLALRGIAMQDGQYTAFVEDTATGQTTRVQVGQWLAQGRVTQINLDSIQYEKGAEVRQIAVGSSLEGQPVAAASQPGPVVASPATAAEVRAESTEALSILEQLRRRRLAELQGR